MGCRCGDMSAPSGSSAPPGGRISAIPSVGHPERIHNPTAIGTPALAEPSVARRRGFHAIRAMTPALSRGLIAVRSRTRGRINPRRHGMRGTGRVVFAATLLLLVGTLNIIYGIGSLDDANIFVNDKRYILTNLNTLGWVLIVLGVIQLTGGFSLMAGN